MSKGVWSYCHPSVYNGTYSVLYHNNGDATFTDVSEKAGISGHLGKGLGVVAADLDDDGRMDIFVANDTAPNFLFHNNGDSTFRESGVLSGTAYSVDGQTRSGMGVDVADFDRDGKPDILITNFSLEGAALYRNEGAGFFSDVASQLGLREHSFLYTGWGTKLFDYDNDGDLDIFMANGHVLDDVAFYNDTLTYAQPKLLLENREGKFVDVSQEGDDIRRPSVGRGVAFGDYDNDGDTDILVANDNQAPNLLRNESRNRNNWIKLRLIGTKSNRDAIGAKVKVVSGDLIQIEQIKGGGSYLSAQDLRLNFGLGRRN